MRCKNDSYKQFTGDKIENFSSFMMKDNFGMIKAIINKHRRLGKEDELYMSFEYGRQ